MTRPAAAGTALLLVLTGCTSPASGNLKASWDEAAFGSVGAAPSFHHAAVDIGERIVVWGGTREDQPCHQTVGGSAATFDLAAGRWRALPPGPLTTREDPHAHWTGTDVLIIGGAVHRKPCNRTSMTDAAAYRPDAAGGAGAWRLLTRPPLPEDAWIAATVWTGRELLVWAGPDGAAAYQPNTDTWRTITSPPTPPQLADVPADRDMEVVADSVWTGDEWLIWGTVRSTPTDRVQTSIPWSVGYRPEQNSWRPIAGLPATVPEVAPVWTGEEAIVLVLDPSPGSEQAQRAVVARYDQDNDTWTEGAASPEPLTPVLAGGLTAWVGDRLITWAAGLTPPADCAEYAGGDGCGREPVPVTVTYDPTTDRWARVVSGPWERRHDVPAVWTGRELVITGGSDRDGVSAATGPATSVGRLSLPPSDPVPGGTALPSR